MVATRCLTRHYADTFEYFHEYVLDEYEFWFESKIIENKNSIPTAADITKGAYEEIYQNLTEILREKVNNESKHNYKYEISSEIYSNLFDQKFINKEIIDDHSFFNRLTFDVENYFALYQLFYRKGEDLIHQPVVEVW